MFDIVTIGSASRDVFITSKDLKLIKSPDFNTGQALAMSLGSKLTVDKIVITIGGGGTNTAVTFARQGLKTSCIGVVGEDSIGREITSALEAENVDTQYFQKHDDDISAYSVIIVDESGERTILSYKGEGQHFNAAKLDLEKIETGWAFVDSVGGKLDILNKISGWAAARGVKLASNPGSGELALGLEKLKSFFSQCGVVIMNQEEAAGLAGILFENEAEIFKFMDREIGGIFVMTKGHAGAVVSDGKQLYKAGVPDSPIVERTGAGDAFSSGFVSEYIRSGDISKAIQLGTANASSVVTQFGAKAGILRKGDMGPWPLVEVQVENL